MTWDLEVSHPSADTDSMDAPAPHDVVELADSVGDWPAGTTGTVVDDLGDGVLLVELAGPDGATLDLLDLPASGVHVVERCRPLVPSGH